MELKSTIREILTALVFAVVFYQILSIFLSVSIPITSVVSNSMDHNNDFDRWWSSKIDIYKDYDFTKSDFQEFPFKKGINKGDLIISTGIKKEDIEIGDVIIYKPKDGNCFKGLTSDNTIIHRVVRIDDEIYTMGDSVNNNMEDVDSNEKSCIGNIEGKAILALPLLGNPRLFIFEIAGI